MPKEGGEKPNAGQKPKSVFNPDAPEFSPSQNRGSRQLNADAPEFIPGQLGSYDGGIGYVSVPEVKHGKGHYKDGYSRPGPPMYPSDNQYVPRWVPPHQQYVSMWMPYHNNIYAKNGMYDYMHYGYGQGHGFEGPEMHPRGSRGPKRNMSEIENHKREADIAFAGRGTSAPMHVQNAEIEFTPQEPLEGEAQGNDGTTENVVATRVPYDSNQVQQGAPQRPLSWADRFRLSGPEQVVGQANMGGTRPSATMWNGRPSFADMMRRSVNNVRNEPIEKDHVLESHPADKQIDGEVTAVASDDNKDAGDVSEETLYDAVSGDEALEAIVEEYAAAADAAAAETVEEFEVAEEAEIEHEPMEPQEVEQTEEPVKGVSEEERKASGSAESDLAVAETAKDSQEEAAKPQQGVPAAPPTDDSDMIYSADQLIKYGMYMIRHGLLQDSKLAFTHTNVRDYKGGSGRGGNNSAHYDDKGASKQRGAGGDHWSMQRRQVKSDGKSFANGFKSSSMDFSRDQLEAVSLPRASESSWIMKQAKLKMDKDQQLTRKLMGLLNRLTVEKFDTIYKNVLTSGVETYQHALMLVKIIFEKAITQHHFIPMYVELCAKLSYDFSNFTQGEKEKGANPQEGETENKLEQKGGRRSDFMRILLNCCQDSFESNLKPLEFPPELEGDDKFEYELKYKHRMRGNMIFVGELFKQKLLAAKLLITCLDQVFAKREECIASTGSIDTGDNHLEGMCTLLQTVGKSFDTDKWKYAGELEKRIQMLTELGKDTNICFRIRCLIQNVLDSRHENWVMSTPYKLEGPCRLQELRTKVMEQEKQQEENTWRNRRRNRMFEQKQPSNTTMPPNVLATPAPTTEMTSEELKRRTRGIVRELFLSHDANEATLCVTELNLPQHRDKELYAFIFYGALEACAKITADRDRSVIAKWLADLAASRSTKKMLISWLQGFLKDEPIEHGYSMMIEDYPVVPRMLNELLNNMKDGYDNIPGFFEVASFIENENSNLTFST